MCFKTLSSNLTTKQWSKIYIIRFSFILTIRINIFCCSYSWPIFKMSKTNVIKQSILNMYLLDIFYIKSEKQTVRYTSVKNNLKPEKTTHLRRAFLAWNGFINSKRPHGIDLCIYRLLLKKPLSSFSLGEYFSFCLSCIFCLSS